MSTRQVRVKIKTNIDEEDLFALEILQDEELIGEVFAIMHPHSSCGLEVHLEIQPKWRCRWLSRGLRDEIMNKLITKAKEHKIKMIYSTALTPISPRLLEFFGFNEYYNKQPKTYYYKEVI